MFLSLSNALKFIIKLSKGSKFVLIKKIKSESKKVCVKSPQSTLLFRTGLSRLISKLSLIRSLKLLVPEPIISNW